MAIMMRRIAVVGDKLSNDGEISAYKGPQFLVNGHQTALIGGAAYCPVCMTTGYIAKDGGPRRMSFFISEVAVHDDVIICDCPTPPRIFAKLAGEAWYDDMAEPPGKIGVRTTASGGTSLVGLEVLAADHARFDEQIRATTSSVGLDGYPYFIEMADGRILSGRLEPGGTLPRMTTGENPDEYMVYWGEDALERSNEN